MVKRKTPSASPKSIQDRVLAAILVLLLLVVCRLFVPFFTVLLWSTLLYVLFSPLHQRLAKNLDFSTPKGIFLKNLLAVLFSLVTVIIILLPLSFVAFKFFQQITELIRLAMSLFNDTSGGLKDLLRDFSVFIRDISSGQISISADEIQAHIISLLSFSLQELLQMSRAVAVNVGSFLIGFAFMLFCLFFFYLDGPYLSRLFLRLIPIRKKYLNELAGKFKDITKNLFLGYIMVALVQAVMAYIIFLIFRIQGSLVFAGLVLIAAFIPIFGAGLVWFPIGIIKIIGGDLIGGIVFLITAGFFISTLDNFLRPMFLRNRIKLHPLIIFFSILGGIAAFGFNGVVLGPMAVLFCLTVLDLFLAEHKMAAD